MKTPFPTKRQATTEYFDETRCKPSHSDFRSTKQAEAIADILKYMSTSNAYDEHRQEVAKTLANRVWKHIQDGVILDRHVTYTQEGEDVLVEAFDIYVKTKRQYMED